MGFYKVSVGMNDFFGAYKAKRQKELEELNKKP